MSFQLIQDGFIPNFKLKYKDSENIKADRVIHVQSFSTYVKSNVGPFYWDTRYFISYRKPKSDKIVYHESKSALTALTLLADKPRSYKFDAYNCKTLFTDT